VQVLDHGARLVVSFVVGGGLRLSPTGRTPDSATPSSAHMKTTVNIFSSARSAIAA
jgi:hypothetical protein